MKLGQSLGGKATGLTKLSRIKIEELVHKPTVYIGLQTP